MKTRWLLTWVVLGIAVAARAELRVPRVAAADTKIVLDGIFASEEWKSALALPLPGDGSLHLCESGGRVWLAIVPGVVHATYVDIFLQDAGGVVHNLHASLQWGERVVAGTTWTDSEPETRWGPPKNWSANRIEWAPGGREQPVATKRSFRPYEAHEFSIERAAFPGAEWRVRIEVRDFAGQQPDVVLPAGSARYDPSGWTVWRLE